ncbi:hypothetical protein MTR67_017584 [Solanum verrucosum]|uniref:DUF4283 domain-containing protein n=1 Tax=Solanum verrucosum TaxID=315347 RepID=A0AAF0QQJ9_SOLVR|nr:hypothetical protein MTR67_017584 [Solanum verrucosum]
MNDGMFLFEFPSRKTSEHVMEGEWSWRRMPLKLEWWKPNYRMLASGNQEGLGMDQSFRDSSESVVRGNLQTYRREMQRLIETEEEITLKNHLHWASIKVKGDGARVPREIEVNSEGFVYQIPIWCETPVTVKKEETKKEGSSRSRGGYLAIKNEVPQIQQLANILGCKVEHLPIIHLGMPLGSKHKTMEIWNGILVKTEKKLARWKAQCLSLGGRLILINSVLDSLPTYVMSLFPIPVKVVKKLDKLRRNFLWKSNKEGKGYNLVNWKNVLLSKERGGLGIRNLRLQNESLLMKWLWRYTEEDAALWKEVIVAKYGELNPWCTKITSEPYGGGGETNNHLFLHCKFTAQIRNLFLNITSMNRTMPEHTSDLLSCWIRRGGSKSQKRWWKLISSCVW